MRQADIRWLAWRLCILAGKSCAQVHDPERPPCTYKNCRMIGIARDALDKAKNG